MEKAQGEMNEAQDNFSAQQGEMSTQMEEIKKIMDGMHQLLEFVQQAQVSATSRVPKGVTALEPVVDGEESTGGTRADEGASVDSAPDADVGKLWMKKRTKLLHPPQT